MQRITLISAALAASTLMGIGAANAAPAYVVMQAPPAPQAETIPAPRAGRVWVEGHYQWRHGQYAWVPGHWMGARRNMQWEQAHWVQRPDGQWTFVEGRWRPMRGNAYGARRDADGDGVANRFDRFPNNPRRS